MAIDYKSLFSSNLFTRAQVDVLILLSERILAEGGGGGGVADNTKADKVTTLIASTGLLGGGDLSQNRTFSLDLTFLDARYPKITDGKISPSVMPSISTTDRFVVASEAAMLALSTANKGDLAIRTDVSKTFILADEPYSTLSNWSELLTPAAAVASFNGRTGTIVPTTGDYTFAQIGSKPTTLVGFGITDAEPAIAAGTATQYRRGDKTWQELNKAAVGLGNVDNTADNAKPLGTAQLATLAAGTGGDLVGTLPPGTGGIVRPLNTVLNEGRLSLRGYALADGTDETTKVGNWLAALNTSKRKGYIPAGTYKIGNIAVSGDFFDIECHPEAKFEGLTGGASPMIQMTSATGTASVRVGRVVWKGGQFDVSIRDLTTEGTGCGVKLINYASVDWSESEFKGGADHEAAEAAAKAGSGLRLFACGRPNVHNNIATGFVEAGIHLSGGSDAVSTADDTAGGVVTGNHLVKCKFGVVATRGMRNVNIHSNDFDQCFEGVLATPGDTAVPAARVSVNNNRFRRPGKSAVHLRLQVGFTANDNVVIDPGYKLDGTTVVTAGTCKVIHTEGCKGGEIQGNVIRMEELVEASDTYGVANQNYLFNSVTTEPQEISTHNNNISGVQYGCDESGATGVGNAYSENTFSSVDTPYNNIPAEFLPYGSWSPVTTNITNVAASSANPSLWRRTGPDISCNLHFEVDPTAAGLAEIEVDLPVDPGYNFANDYDLIGVAASGTTATGGAVGHIIAKVGADRKARLRLSFDADDITNHTWAGTFAYRCIPTVAAPPPPGGLLTLHTEDGTTPIHLEDGTTIIEV